MTTPGAVSGAEWSRAAALAGPYWRCTYCGKAYVQPGGRCCYCNEPFERQNEVMEYDSMFHADSRHTRRAVFPPTVYLLTPQRYAALVRYLVGGWMPPWVSVHEERAAGPRSRVARRTRALRNLVAEPGDDEVVE